MNRNFVKTISRSLMLLMLLAAVSICGAATVNNATITQIRPDNVNGGGIFIYANGGTYGGTATCYNPQNIAGEKLFFLRQDNAMYSELKAAAFMAHATGNQVYLVGNGACSGAAGSDYEDLRYIQLR